MGSEVGAVSVGGGLNSGGRVVGGRTLRHSAQKLPRIVLLKNLVPAYFWNTTAPAAFLNTNPTSFV